MRRFVPLLLLLALLCYHLDPTSGASYRKELDPIYEDDGLFHRPIPENIICDELDPNILELLLGPAYNPRYMSVETPNPQLSTSSADVTNKNNQKRKADPKSESFSVSENYYDVVDNSPAWEMRSHVEPNDLVPAYDHRVKKRHADRCGDDDDVDESKLTKRDVDLIKQWQCKSKIIWTDLGPDYFPRYLRSVECLKKNCWFDLYQCTPRSFTVKILRRRRGKCMKVDKAVTKMGVLGLPNELKEVWVWEERAVAFCCECTRNKAIFY